MKNFNSKPFWCVFLLGVMILFTQISTINAADWDNVGTYYEDTRTMEIRNSVLGIPWFQLSKVASVTLISPKSVYVIYGEDVQVAEIRLEVFEETSPPSEVKFYNYADMIPKNKNFNYKYLTTETADIFDTEEVCEYSINDTYVCETVDLLTTHEEEREVWKVFKKDEPIPVGSYTLGIFSDVGEGERTE